MTAATGTTGTTPTPGPFEVEGPIPLGRTTLIEASAGTGKTYALTAICVRLVAEYGVPIDRILVVTFTRAATAELRDRVRRRLVEAERHLGGPRPVPGEEIDPVLAALERTSSGQPCADAERNERRARVARAVSDFDTATISTIHGFCAQVRASIGVLADHNTDAVPAESETELIAQVCADLYFRALSLHERSPFGDRNLTKLIDLVKKARTLSGAEVVASSGLVPDHNVVALVEEAVAEIDLRLRRQGGQSFDSLLATVRDALGSDDQLVHALRDQFAVALIDEFQDTDPVQWEIFRTVFAEGVDEVGGLPRALFLVGDPKQAIYAFRGGDVYTYLAARVEADTRVLTTNHRSDPAVLDAMNAMAAGHVYGEPEIAYQQVTTAPGNLHRRAYRSGGEPLPGLALRCLEPRKGGGIPSTASGARRAIATDLAQVAHQLLGEVRFIDHKGDDVAVRPGDIAVLVGATSDARPVAEALRQAGIPVVLRLRDDVADSDAREQWRVLLHALDRPGSINRAAAAALTWFFGWAPEMLVRAVEAPDEEDLDHRHLLQLQHQLAAWGKTLTEHGMAALYGEARRSNDLVARLLTTDSGERDLTDLEHLAELIHAEARAGGRGLTAGTALEILDGLGGTPEDEIAADAAQRRIESDADAVQIMTIHGSKGLEFPFVLLPSLYAGGARVKATRPHSYFDQGRSGRVIDLSSANDPDTGKKRAERARTDLEKAAEKEAKRQNCGDQHRLTYVALTRAQHQTVAWWAPTGGGVKLSGLTRMVLGRPGTAAADEVTLPTDGEAAPRIAEIIQECGAGGVVTVEALDPDTPVVPGDLPPLPTGAGALPAPTDLCEASLGRRLDRLGKVWSFSSLAKDLHVGVPDHDPGDPVVEQGDDTKAHDEPPGQDDAAASGATDAEPEPTDHGDWDLESPFAGLGGGKDFGNLVHHLLEVLDFQAEDLEGTLADLMRRPTGYRITDAQHDRLPHVLAEVVRTPLGSDFGDARLVDLRSADRLNELAFHFTLPGDRPVSAGRIGAVVAEHLGPSDPLHAWARGLERGLAGTGLQGFLNGSIDLTLRRHADGLVRYSVVDYKTNNLAPGEAAPSLQSYRRSRLTRAMADNQYALQSLVYSVALHRYLRWRLPDYDPAVHLGPVGYLYVRGMVGAPTPTEPFGPGGTSRAGVFTWQVPHELVLALSSLFTGGQDHGSDTGTGGAP